MTRKKIAAGNWKMNTTYDEAVALAKHIAQGDRMGQALTILGVPFPFLHGIKEITEQYAGIEVAAQNCHQEASGAYTGEVSSEMLKSMGVKYVILGHSERRQYFGESNELLKAKVQQALQSGLHIIFCCGEPLEVRKSGHHLQHVIQQLDESIFGFDRASIKSMTIAYEPIWAIGTGETASADQAQEMHAAIRARLAERYDNELAQQTSILYGGSVKPSNAAELFGKKDVDGGLVGGASLDGDGFIQIINAFN